MLNNLLESIGPNMLGFLMIFGAFGLAILIMLFIIIWNWTSTGKLETWGGIEDEPTEPPL